jgi:hypothetical protein
MQPARIADAQGSTGGFSLDLVQLQGICVQSLMHIALTAQPTKQSNRRLFEQLIVVFSRKAVVAVGHHYHPLRLCDRCHFIEQMGGLCSNDLVSLRPE